MPNDRKAAPLNGGGPAPRPFFTRVSQAVSKYAGKPVTFIGAVLVIVIWGATGPLFGFNDTWQLIINTSTTIVTFLMVFLIQNSQNRDTAALQIKLDELISRTEGPRNALLDLEDLDEEMLERLRADYARLADIARAETGEGAEVQALDRTIGEICAPDDTAKPDCPEPVPAQAARVAVRQTAKLASPEKPAVKPARRPAVPRRRVAASPAASEGENG